jgi:hypothetical protein
MLFVWASRSGPRLLKGGGRWTGSALHPRRGGVGTAPGAVGAAQRARAGPVNGKGAGADARGSRAGHAGMEPECRWRRADTRCCGHWGRPSRAAAPRGRRGAGEGRQLGIREGHGVPSPGSKPAWVAARAARSKAAHPSDQGVAIVMSVATACSCSAKSCHSC